MLLSQAIYGSLSKAQFKRVALYDTVYKPSSQN